MHSRNITSSARAVWGGYSCPPTAFSKIAQSGNSRCYFLLTLCLTVLAQTPWALAQRAASAHGTSHPATPHFNSRPANFASGRATHGAGLRRSPYSSLPFPFFSDSFDPDDIYSTGYPVASQPPVILLQAARALARPLEAGPAEHAENEPPSQPLIIELQNGRYVRVNNAIVSGEAQPLNLTTNTAPSEPAPPPKSSRSHSTQPAVAAASPPHDLQPALLIFRDGHSEEVRDYTIADGTLYARGDYYTDGYWNKKIAISALNVAQTIEANAQRSVRFVLPVSPNEVITRP